MRAVLVGATLVATAWAGGTRRVGSDWPHHGVGSAPRIPIGYPLPAPRAVRSPQGRTVVVKGDSAARGNNDAPDLRPWWRRQAIPDVHAAWVEDLLKNHAEVRARRRSALAIFDTEAKGNSLDALQRTQSPRRLGRSPGDWASLRGD